MELIICENTPFGFDTIQVSKSSNPSDSKEVVVKFQPRCDLQLPAGLDINSLPCEEREYFERVKEVASSYRDKFGRYLCVHLNFPRNTDKNTNQQASLGLHGFFSQNSEEVDGDLWMEDINLSLKISLSMSVLQYRTMFDFRDEDLSKSSQSKNGNSGANAGGANKFARYLSEKAHGNSKFKLATDTTTKTISKPDGDNSKNSKEGNIIGKEGIYLVKSAENKMAALKLGIFKSDGSFDKDYKSAACSLINTEISLKPQKETKGNRDEGSEGKELISVKGEPTRTTQNEASGNQGESCVGKDIIFVKAGLKLPSNIATFLTEERFQVHPYFLAGVINVSLICHLNNRQRLSNQIVLCRKILQENVKSDVEIIAENGIHIKCHQSFLAVHSKIFHKDLQVDGKKNTIEMKDISEESVRAFLEYCYTGDLSTPNEASKVALELLKVAHRFEISSLEMKMRDILCSKNDGWFSLEVALNLFLFLRGVDNSDTKEKLKAIQIIKSKSKELRECELYRNIFKTNPEAGMDLCTYLSLI